MNIRIGAIVVCRFDSRRLPGKALRDVAGKPLLWYVLSRCRQANGVDHIVVATTTREIDDPVEAWCRTESIDVFRGPTDDVAGRVLECASAKRFDYFVRVNGDSPFFDPELARVACSIARSSHYEIITNLYPRSFPYGISIEVINTEAFRRAYGQMNRPDHFEHVTLYLYEHMDDFRFYNIANGNGDLGRVRMTVDTPEDLSIFEEVAAAATGKWHSLSYGDMIRFYQKGEGL